MGKFDVILSENGGCLNRDFAVPAASARTVPPVAVNFISELGYERRNHGLDDFVMGFEKEADACEMLLALKDRLARFGLALHEDKTQLIEFGRFAALTRQRHGERRPETFAFLGFVHYCGRTRDGRFIVRHKTEGKRLTLKLTAVRDQAWRLMHAPLATQHDWYAAVLRGHYGYYGRPHNDRALNGFYLEVRRVWLRSLRRRSQKSRRMG